MDNPANEPQKIIADLSRKLEALTAERDATLAQEAAATEVLQVISSTTGNLTPVFDMIVEKAVRLCDAYGGALWLVKDAMARAVGEPRWQDAEGVLRIRCPRVGAGQILIGPGRPTPVLRSHTGPQRRPSPTRRALLFSSPP
jgi:hypothetical protein